MAMAICVAMQVAVAIMRKFVMEPGMDANVAAERFAKQLHDSWGVGDPACNNGVLFLLALENRQLYFSTGKGASGHLTDGMLDTIISSVRPLLRAAKYVSARRARRACHQALHAAARSPRMRECGLRRKAHACTLVHAPGTSMRHACGMPMHPVHLAGTHASHAPTQPSPQVPRSDMCAPHARSVCTWHAPQVRRRS